MLLPTARRAQRQQQSWSFWRYVLPVGALIAIGTLIASYRTDGGDWRESVTDLQRRGLHALRTISTRVTTPPAPAEAIRAEATDAEATVATDVEATSAEATDPGATDVEATPIDSSNSAPLNGEAASGEAAAPPSAPATVVEPRSSRDRRRDRRPLPP